VSLGRVFLSDFTINGQNTKSKDLPYIVFFRAAFFGSGFLILYSVSMYVWCGRFGAYTGAESSSSLSSMILRLS
jgi:hypothetical protein